MPILAEVAIEIWEPGLPCIAVMESADRFRRAWYSYGGLGFNTLCFKVQGLGFMDGIQHPVFQCSGFR